VLIASEEPLLVQRLKVPDGITAVLLHPQAKIETRKARAILKSEVPMRVAVEHSRRVAAFIAGCTTGNLDLVRTGLSDLLVEPQRVHLLPVLPEVQKAAVVAGALGCSFSGSGPSVFAWAPETDAEAVEGAMMAAFTSAGIPARAYHAPAASEGVRVSRIGEQLAA
jgi:homoserine kinase